MSSRSSFLRFCNCKYQPNASNDEMVPATIRRKRAARSNGSRVEGGDDNDGVDDDGGDNDVEEEDDDDDGNVDGDGVESAIVTRRTTSPNRWDHGSKKPLR